MYTKITFLTYKTLEKLPQTLNQEVLLYLNPTMKKQYQFPHSFFFNKRTNFAHLKNCNVMMKYISIFIVFFLISACKNEDNKKDNGLEEVRIDGKTSNSDIVRMPISADKPLDTTNIAKIVLEETDVNFGEVTEGAVVKHTFKFKNTGNQPLLISDIRTTCGCTVPEWNHNPMPSGSIDKIDVKFNTEGKQDMQTKKITIIANTFPAETEIILRGVVKVTPSTRGKSEK
jgi:Protein of unknown function (DUF1573)